MNIQIHEILSNPELLKEVSEETLNSWIKQYPYVPIFHLYSLKRKQNYTETDLHKTAFYINNREKLYFLLKQDSKKDYKTKTAETPYYHDEISTADLPEENNIAINEIVTDNKAEEIIDVPEISVFETKENEPIKEDSKTQESETVYENKTELINKSTDKNKITETEIIKPEIITEENAIITVNESEAIIETPQVSEETIANKSKPLSIADQILAEIKLLKEERAKALQAAEHNIKNISTEKESVTIPQETLKTDLSENENITKTETELIDTENKINPEIEIQENDSVTMPPDKEELTEHAKESAETESNIPATEKTTSIQDEIIARLQQIKAEREAKANSEPELNAEQVNILKTNEPIEEITETDTSEFIPEKTLSVQDEIIERIQKIKAEREAKANNEPELNAEQVNILKTNEPIEEITETDTSEFIPEKTLSIQDEIIERIQKIKAEREAKEKSETELQKENVIPAITKAITEITEPLEEIIEIGSPEKIQLSAAAHLSENIETEKEVLQPELKSEQKDIDTPFGEAYQKPLLVHIEPSAAEKKVFTDLIFETQKEDKAEPAEEKIPEKNLQTIKEEKPIPEIVLDKVLISEKPQAEKEIIEPITETDLTESLVSKLDEEKIKEPHTFVEWLKLLDGNLQIQTTETPTEKEWIEIPQYEVMQTIANKKQIQAEEAKIFEPNFEEGEIDLFNEIDEEVTKSATESVSFKQDMMTETLAKIYTKQGKTDKALEIYNALLLKFPEKSSYFATLIQNLQK
jgi:predicted CopG family antitoxin